MKKILNSEKLLNLSVRQLFVNTMRLNKTSKILLIFDSSTKNLINYFENFLKKKKLFHTIKQINLQTNHGFEPSSEIASIMKIHSHVLCITKFSMAHSKARKDFSKYGGRYLSMPGYSKKMLLNEALKANFIKLDKNTSKLSNILTNGKKCLIKSDDGTCLYADIKNRVSNSCPGHVLKKGSLGSPPDIESNISPIESKSNGLLVINGSIANDKIGLLKNPVYLSLEKGKIKKIKSKSIKVKKFLERTFKKFGHKSRILGEIGIGLNKKSKLTGNMLTDEGAYGCIHFGFGSNFSVGGKNKVNFHLDFITKKHSLFVDNKLIIKKGRIVI